MKFIKSKPGSQHSTKEIRGTKANKGLHPTYELEQVRTAIPFGKAVKAVEALKLWADHLAVYSTPKTTLNKLTCLKAWLRDKGLGDTLTNAITPDQIESWINDPSHPDKAGTRLVKLSCIKSFFEFCAIREMLMADPSLGINVRYDILTDEQKGISQPKVFTPEQFQKLMEHIELLIRQASPEHRGRAVFWRVATLIGRYTGLRLGHIVNLRMDALTEEPGHIVFFTAKTNTKVLLPLPQSVRTALSKFKNRDLESENPFVFPDLQAMYSEPKKRSGLSVAFSRMCTLSGSSGFGFEHLRDTYVSDCTAAGLVMPHIEDKIV